MRGTVYTNILLFLNKSVACGFILLWLRRITSMTCVDFYFHKIIFTYILSFSASLILINKLLHPYFLFTNLLYIVLRQKHSAYHANLLTKLIRYHMSRISSLTALDRKDEYLQHVFVIKRCVGGHIRIRIPRIP